MKNKYTVVALTGIGYVYHHQIYAESREEAMKHLENIEEECDYYWDHCDGLIEIHDAWINDDR